MTGEAPAARADSVVVVSGMGIVSALGTGCAQHWAAVRDGRHGMRAVDRFDTSDLSTHLAGTWPGWDGVREPVWGPGWDLRECAAVFPVAHLALIAAREACDQAGLPTAIERGDYARSRIALVLGTCFGQGFREFHELTHTVAVGLGIEGPELTVSTACASSTNAIGLARDLLLHDRADVVIAGGADALLREVFAGFSALGVLSAEPCAPFSQPEGTTLAEGAGFVVLERGNRAALRSVPTFAIIRGYGLSADAFHETTPDPTGAGLSRAINGALSNAAWQGRDIDYVNAHATGTSTNDRAEWMAIERETGPRDIPVLVSGSKGHCGHAQGAAGAIELILSLLAMQHGHVPATLNFRGARPGCPSDPIGNGTSRPHDVQRALKISAAFGGANAVLAFESASGAPPTVDRPLAAWRPVAVIGVGIVGPVGALVGADLELSPERRWVGSVPVLSMREIDPSVNPRRLDRASLHLIAASSLALRNVPSHSRRLSRDRSGLFLGAARMSDESSARCIESMKRNGAAGASGSAFARMSVNAPAGACAKALGLRGPATTVSTGEGSGLLAIALAAQWLATRDDADRLLACAQDEIGDATDSTLEAATCVVLERAQDPSASAARITGIGIAGPGQLSLALTQALGPDVLLDSVDHVVGDAVDGRDVIDVSLSVGFAEATRSALSFALAVQMLQRGKAHRLLVTSSRGACASIAILLERPEHA